RARATPRAMLSAGRDLAADALRRAGSSRMDSVAYDTGFVARLVPLMGGDPLVEGALRYLRAAQSPAGWWGSARPSGHDRVLSTLSAACGLAAARDPADRPALERAAAWLADAMPRLAGDRQLVGSDLLIPPLVERASEAGLGIDARASPYRGVGRVATSLYGRVFYSGHPVGHLLEVLGDRLDAPRALRRLANGPSGSVMCAPSATAFVLERAGRADPRAVAYLRASANADGGVRHFGPYEVMEAGYSLYALRHTPLFALPHARAPLRLLREAWLPGGVGFAREFPAVDLDDSAIAALVLHASGEPVAPDFLDRFLDDGYFLCYLADRRGAVAPNLHAVEALRVLGHPERDALSEVALGYLRGQQQASGAFLDHYSLSPFYPTWHAIEALGQVDASRAERCARFLASRQRDDGAFDDGVAPATAEGSAYALLGLAAWERAHPGEFADAIERGAGWLAAHAGDPPCAEWVAKVLYAPTTMAKAAVAGALAACAMALEPRGGLSLSPSLATPGATPPTGARRAQAPAARVAVSQQHRGT
ncbi:MAG TPA: prenyltransferase/squalene oxidase repeat-containing protein, partial [Candidatus Thermoplasmatota archaeon]